MAWTDQYYDGLRSNIKRYASQNLEVHITELDVKCKLEEGGECEEKVWTEELLQEQAEHYGKILTICLEEPNCTAFQTWGYTDYYSWLDEPMNGLPFERNGLPKPAYDKMIEVLENFDRNHNGVTKRLNRSWMS